METPLTENNDKKTGYSKEISRVIHDLNNILGPVSGYADMILYDNCKNTGTPENSKLAQRIEKIRLCMKKATEILERLNKLKNEIEK